MLNLKEFKDLEIKQNTIQSLNSFEKCELENIYSVRGGGEYTDGGSKSFPGCTFDYSSDCRTQTANGWTTKYCGISNSTC